MLSVEAVTVEYEINVLFDYNRWFPKVGGIPTYTGASLFMVKLELFKALNHRWTLENQDTSYHSTSNESVI